MKMNAILLVALPFLAVASPHAHAAEESLLGGEKKVGLLMVAPEKEDPTPGLQKRNLPENPIEKAMSLREGHMAVNSPMKVSQTDWVERLDSITSVDFFGDRLGSQTFTYDEEGRPLQMNYYTLEDIYDPYCLAGYVKYEYDEIGRRVTYEQFSDTGLLDTFRYTYSYNDETELFCGQTYYSYDKTTGEWTAIQKAEYEYYDGYPVSQVFYALSEEGEWVALQKDEAMYDSKGRMTIYKRYLMSDGKWVIDTRVKNFSASYDWDDRIIKEYWYITDEGFDLAYFRLQYEYAADGTVTKITQDYWNKTDFAYTGLQGYEALGNTIKTNTIQEFSYDDDLREIRQDIYVQNTNNEYPLVQSVVKTYNDMGNEALERIVDTYYGDTIYRRTIEQFNSFGSETYYKSGLWSEAYGKFIWQQEEFRYMDECNNFLGGDYYSFLGSEENTRRGSSKERFEYAEGYDPTLGELPISGHHWICNTLSDTEWKDKSHYDFEWDNINVLVGTTIYEYDLKTGERFLKQKSFSEFDFDSNVNDILRWPLSGKSSTYYQYKYLSSTEWNNIDGDDEWDAAYSYSNIYHYSPIVNTGIEAIHTDGCVNAEEIGRYNTAGVEVSRDTKGLVIVKYSDGSVRKLIVK